MTQRLAALLLVLFLAPGCDSRSTPATKPAGVTVGPVTANTTESGGTSTFTVVLDSAPTADVTVHFSSDNTAETTLSASSLTFTEKNWETQQKVVLTGVDDLVEDGDQTVHVVFTATTSTDSRYQGVLPKPLTLMNRDDDTAGYLTTTSGQVTTESGGLTHFTLALRSKPAADVTVFFRSDKPTEGAPALGQLTFSTSNWNVAQEVAVFGVDDAVADGNQPFLILFTRTQSEDPRYAFISPSSIPFTNVDDDAPGITVTAPSGPTTEAGGTATFTVQLNSAPAGEVTVTLGTDRASEGTLSAASLTFTADTWATPQTVTATGVDDPVADGNQVFNVVFGETASTDAAYAAITPAAVRITNVDDDHAGFLISPASGPTSEAGGSATFTVVLTSRPLAPVMLGFASTDLSEGHALTAAVLFDATQWDVPQTVTVMGNDDALVDGVQPYAVAFTASTSTDVAYHAVTPPPVTFFNLDND